MKHNAEIPGCDLCLEIDQLNFLNESLDITNFERVCRYLESCAAYRSIFSYNVIIKIYEILSHLLFILFRKVWKLGIYKMKQLCDNLVYEIWYIKMNIL